MSIISVYHVLMLVMCSHDLMVTLNQKTMAEGKDYCDRKIKLLRSNFDQLIEVL